VSVASRRSGVLNCDRPLGADEAAKLREHFSPRHVSIEYKAGDGNHQQQKRRK
jgi:hypothetical protein